MIFDAVSTFVIPYSLGTNWALRLKETGRVEKDERGGKMGQEGGGRGKRSWPSLGYINCAGTTPSMGSNGPLEMQSSSTLTWSMTTANRLRHNEAFLIVIPSVSTSLTIFNPLKSILPWKIRLPVMAMNHCCVFAKSTIIRSLRERNKWSR